MLRNYFLIAWRNLLRNRVYSLINILGLATGVACCLLIALYVWHEYSYDRFHPEAERIYLVAQQEGEDPEARFGNTAPIMGERLQADLPEVEAIVRQVGNGGLVRALGQAQEDPFRVDGINYVDSNFFQFFNFELLRGDPRTALLAPNQVVLTETWREKLFGEADPMGQMIEVDDRLTYQVAGVVADPPDHSTLQFDLLVSWPTIYAAYRTESFESWWWPATYTYARLTPQAPIAELNQTRLREFVQPYRGENNSFYPHLRRLPDLHLYGLSGEGAMRYVSLFSIVAVILLLIACVNFMNLSTARSARRAREVGVRKAVGASRGNLIRQFLGESFLITFIAVLLGLALAELLMPVFNELSGLELSLPWLRWQLWLGLLGVVILVGLIAGSYPAIFLSQFRPVQVLKASLNLKVGGSRLRQGLVVSQFVIGITLIISTLIIWRQHQYMLTKSLGYDQSQLLNVEVKKPQSRLRLDVLTTELEAMEEVASAVPASWDGSASYPINFPVQVEQADGRMQRISGTGLVYTSYDWVETLGINLLEGRDFSEEYGTDAEQAFLVNEEMRRRMGDTSLMGRTVRASYAEFGQVLYEKSGRVVGTFEDFHVRDLRNEIQPMVVVIAATEQEKGNYLGNVSVQLEPGNHREQLAAIKAKWREIFPNQPFEANFAAEKIEDAYRQEERLGNVLTAFTVLAIFIALLGLLGLAAFTAQQRTKEIGVRKILGASKQHILLLLNREFTLLVGVALLISAPLAYWLMQSWLEAYPYRIEFAAWPYLVGGLSALLLSWLIVSGYSLRAVYMNPADALRDE
jgi:putative ABC transport system permease protein